VLEGVFMILVHHLDLYFIRALPYEFYVTGIKLDIIQTGFEPFTQNPVRAHGFNSIIIDGSSPNTQARPFNKEAGALPFPVTEPAFVGIKT
jgi:hypothetical protein